MRTEEEARYDLNEQIFDLYDTGASAKEIAERLGSSTEHVLSVLGGVEIEAG